MRNYYICSVGKPDDGYDDTVVMLCITNNCFVLHETATRIGLIREIVAGDILILKYKHHFIGYGRAISSLLTDRDLDGDGWSWRVEVNLWITGNHVHKYGIQAAMESGGPFDIVKRVERQFALEKIEEIGFPF